MNAPSTLLDWLLSVQHTTDCLVEPISLNHSTAWVLDHGAIRHVSHRFFSVIGAQWTNTEGRIVGQPFLDQPEVGTLGFLIRHPQDPEVLVQAKAEPGNVGVVQLAPTCQATSSNAHQVHGGTKPPFIQMFTQDSSDILYNVLQSEQGTRFFGKRNRNVCMVTNQDVSFSPQAHRWVRTQELLDLLHQSYVINTDARSVLVCSPWEALVGRQPFSRYQAGFGAELAKSFVTPSVPQTLLEVKSKIQSLRTQTTLPQRVNLQELSGWDMTEYGIISKQSFFQIRQVRVSVQGREVPAWDQPFLDSVGPGKVVLESARVDGVLHFLFQISNEPGLYHQVELTPTVVVAPGLPGAHSSPRTGSVIAECWQSEEGGRFFQDKNLFQIVDTGEVVPASASYVWLTLRDIKLLLQEEGWLTNEARSVLSLLLPWM